MPMRDLPAWYLWVGGGFIGAVFVTGAAFLGPRIGFGLFFVVLVAGQLSASLVIDHYAFLKGLPQKRITWARALGSMIAVGVFASSEHRAFVTWSFGAYWESLRLELYSWAASWPLHAVLFLGPACVFSCLCGETRYARAPPVLCSFRIHL